MNRPQGKDGIPYRRHLEGAAKRGFAPAIAKLEGPPIPPALGHLWSWFVELDRARPVGMNGPGALTYEAVEAWNRLLDRDIKPHEVRALFTLDRAIRRPEDFKDMEGSADE